MNMLTPIRYAAAAAPLLFAGGALAQEYAGLSPQEAVRKMTVPEGFSVDLLAHEPDLVQPVAFTFDTRGRIWVVEGNTYPQRAKDGEGKDRILIFSDENGDGTFESRKVFAEGLNLVSGIELGYGGVFVGAAPYLMFIPDRDQDDRPDPAPVGSGAPAVPGLSFHAEILLDGWGWQDTHETLNSFVWGPDGWLYGCHGVFTHSRVGRPGTPDEDRIPLNCAYWRYHPLERSFEVFAQGTSNPWGFHFNDQGEWFAEACVIPHFWHVIQGAYYLRQSNPLGHFNPYVYTNIETIADHFHYIGATPHAGNDKSDAAGGGHAHCGLLIYDGDNFPPEYRGRALMFNIHGRRINQDRIVPKGSGYVASHLPDLLLTNDPWFTGVALKTGPDGAVYFIDWYDQQKCHKTDPLVWDRGNGRLYRLKYDATWKPWKGDLRQMPARELAKLTFSRNGGVARLAAHQFRQIAGSLPAQELDWFEGLLREEGAPGRRPPHYDRTAAELVHAVTRGFAPDRFPDSIRSRVLEALLDPSSEAFGFRLGLLPERLLRDSMPDLLRLSRAEGVPARVRLAIASALLRLPPELRWEPVHALIRHAEDADDHNLPQMYWYVIEPLVPLDTPRALELGSDSRIPLVAQNIARRAAATGESAIAHLVAAMGREKTGEGMKFLLTAAIEGLRGRTGVKAPEAWDRAYAAIEDVAANRQDAIPMAGELLDLRESLAVSFGDRRAFPRLRRQAQDASQPMERRQMALQTLLQGQDPESPALLASLLPDEAMRPVALRSLPQAVATKATAALAGDVLKLYPSMSAADRQTAISSLSTRTVWASALLDAIESGVVPREELPSFSARQILNLGDEGLAAKLTRVWGSISSAGADAAAEIAKFKEILTPSFLRTANLPNGRALYNVTCGTCHTLFGQGAAIGPDLTGSNRADLDYLLENIVDPNALIGKDYELHVFLMKDGRAVAGMVRGETDAAFTVQTLTGQETVAKADIEKHETPGISMMPAGQFTAFTPEQQRDLIAYLGSPSQVPLPGEPGAEKFAVANRVPGALEGEGLTVVRAAGKAGPQPMQGFTRGNWAWSGDAQLWWTGAAPGDRLDLVLPVAAGGKYEIQAVLTKAPDYGIVQFLLDGEPLGRPFDGFSPSGAGVIHTPLFTLGTRELTAGDHRLTLEITGANAEAVKLYMAGIDYLYLKRVD